MIAICGRCGRDIDYGQNSDLLDGHRCTPVPAAPLPSIADVVEADLKLCQRVGHAGPGPLCPRCGFVDEPALDAWL